MIDPDTDFGPITERLPETRTRVLFDRTIKDGYRVKEISIELTNHDNPARETSALFQRLRAQAEHDCDRANAETQPTLLNQRS